MSDRSDALDAAAQLAAGEPIHDGHYRHWPWWGTGNRSVDSELVKFCDALAGAIRGLKGDPARPSPAEGASAEEAAAAGWPNGRYMQIGEVPHTGEPVYAKFYASPSPQRSPAPAPDVAGLVEFLQTAAMSFSASASTKGPFFAMPEGSFAAKLRDSAAALSAQAAEIELIKAARWTPVGDNHHNAALCPYCNPQVQAQAAALAAKEAECERLKGTAHGFVDEIVARDKALQPFAEMANTMDHCRPKATIVLISGESDGRFGQWPVKAFRTARAVLRTALAGKPEEKP